MMIFVAPCVIVTPAQLVGGEIDNVFTADQTMLQNGRCKAPCGMRYHSRHKHDLRLESTQLHINLLTGVERLRSRTRSALYYCRRYLDTKRVVPSELQKQRV